MTEPQQVAIVADSTISLPRELVEKYDLLLVPMELHFGDQVYRDGLDLDAAAFYQMIKDSGKLPTTSAPKPADFLEAFRQGAQRCSSIVCLTLSAELSATYQSACAAAEIARQELPHLTIRIMDTRTAAAAEGLLALEAARAAQKGVPLDDVAQRVQELMPKVYMVGMLDTLYYVWKGGRIPKVAAWLGTLLSIKPILEIAKGEIRLRERPRTKRRAMERLLAAIHTIGGQAPLHAIVVHAAAPDDAQELRQRVQQKFHCRELMVSEFTPVIGAHTGPGLVGCAFYAEETPSR